MRAKPFLIVAIAAVLAPVPVVAGPADAPCVYLAIGCAPNVPVSELAPAPPVEEAPPPAPRRHHRRHHARLRSRY